MEVASLEVTVKGFS